MNREIGQQLDGDRLRELLRPETFFTRLIAVDRISSTNDVLLELAERGAEQGTVLVAEQQSSGRGRRGRVWYSPPGKGLFVSVLFRPGRPTVELTRWTLGAAVAACHACRGSTDADVEIKWPNDLICAGKKLGGVLSETRGVPGEGGQLVVGTGINVDHARGDFPDELSSTATSLRLATGGRAIDRERLAAAYLCELAAVARALERGAWPSVARRWESLSPGARGRRVRVVSSTAGGHQYEGVTSGIDELGALRIRRADGRTESVHVVESVRSLET